MKNDAMGKLSAGFLVLVMALSALVLFPMGNVGQTTSDVYIYVPVLCDGDSVPGLDVNLTDVHTGSVITADYSTDGYYYVTNPPSGYYIVSVFDLGYLDVPNAAEFPFTGKENYNVQPAVSLTKIPDKIFSIEVTVTDSGASPQSGAYVSVYDNTTQEYVAFAATATNASGKVLLSMFNTNDPDIAGHDFYLVVRKDKFEMSLTSVSITSSNPISVQLNGSRRVTGWVNDADGPASGVVSYLINKDNSIPLAKRVMKIKIAALAFDAYDGDYLLVVDAVGAEAYTMEFSVAGLPVSLNLPPLAAQTERMAHTEITYGADFNSFTLTATGDWPFDLAHPGLLYNDMGNLRAQIDLALGDGNGLLDAAEVFDFTALTNSWGAEYVATDSLLTLNETVYYSQAFTGFPFQIAEGTVNDTSSVPFSYECTYAADAGEIDSGAKQYTGIAYARYDTDEVNYTYRINLPALFELTHNESQYTDVRWYTNITLDPSGGHVGSEPVQLIFQEHAKPIALGEVVRESGVVYPEEDDEGNITRYFVKVGADVNFTAKDSSDPNGNPLTFTWDFGDSTVETTGNITWTHKFTTASTSRMVTLNVSDVGGMYNVTEIEVVCDNIFPTAVLSVKGFTINETDYSITVNQRETITFNATNSVDGAVAAGDMGSASIDYFEFDYGDGNKSNRIYWTATDKNVTHSYADVGKWNGAWNVTLNVTDVTGHLSSKVLIVHVNDTAAPTVEFTVKNSTGSSTLKEKEPLWFDASTTKDNLDSNSSLIFHWDFGDGTWLNGTGVDFVNVTHTYTTPKSYTVSLNVTDTAGNHQVTPKVITVGQGLRPKLTVDKVYYNTDAASAFSGNFTEDKRGYIIVNMTNTGSLYAKNITVSFYMIKSDGTEELLGTWTTILNATTGVETTNVSVGGKIQVRFPYTFDSKGTYTIKVNVTCDDQLNPTIYTNAQKLTVKEASWKRPLLYASVIAVLVLVPVLLYVRSRWSKREKKGPRREKKEKPGAGEEEL